MTSMLKDLKDTLVSKLGGQRYHNNLLGESLADLLRKATAKVLVEPDEELNQQVRRYIPLAGTTCPQTIQEPQT